MSEKIDYEGLIETLRKEGWEYTSDCFNKLLNQRDNLLYSLEQVSRERDKYLKDLKDNDVDGYKREAEEAIQWLRDHDY